MKIEAFEQSIERTDQFADRLVALIQGSLLDTSVRVRLCHTTASLSLEHWQATVCALEVGYFSSAVVVHRAQFEAVVRAVWLLYAAPDDLVLKLNENLNDASADAVSNLPMAVKMLAELQQTNAPVGGVAPLLNFKDNGWKHINSFVHAGIHPISRHGKGYPATLKLGVLRNANGLAMHAAMMVTILTSRPALQREIIALAKSFSDCVPLVVDEPNAPL